eukprot:3892462-Amphidinium_carterae.1
MVANPPGRSPCATQRLSQVLSLALPWQLHFSVFFKELISRCFSKSSSRCYLWRLSATTEEQIVRAKPDALLCTLLDDPARSEDASTPIFVEADPGLFRYIVRDTNAGHLAAGIYASFLEGINPGQGNSVLSVNKVFCEKRKLPYYPSVSADM